VVSVDPVSSAAPAVEQHLYFVDHSNKRHLLVDLLDDKSKSRTLVFTRTKHAANKLTQHLLKARVDAAAIHGNKSQSARVRALEGFRKGELRVLVATDVAARGIDVDKVSHVINYDLPNVPETYVHRIGRTGRAGHSGVALSFCSAEERPYLVDIERLIGRKVARVSDHAYPASESPKAVTELPRGAARPRSTPKRSARASGGGDGVARRRSGSRRPMWRRTASSAGG
jgi:ATP-dependent RNA helicase RhlE